MSHVLHKQSQRRPHLDSDTPSPVFARFSAATLQLSRPCACSHNRRQRTPTTTIKSTPTTRTISKPQVSGHHSPAQHAEGELAVVVRADCNGDVSVCRHDLAAAARAQHKVLTAPRRTSDLKVVNRADSKWKITEGWSPHLLSFASAIMRDCSYLSYTSSATTDLITRADTSCAGNCHNNLKTVNPLATRWWPVQFKNNLQISNAVYTLRRKQ